jgi:transcriptional regulator with XRE-family HTH domain
MLMWDRQITQASLAPMLGIEQSALSKKLRGSRSWSIQDVASAARALNTTVAYLVGEVDDPMCTPSDLNREPTDSGSECLATVSDISEARSLRLPYEPLEAS